MHRQKQISTDNLFTLDNSYPSVKEIYSTVYRRKLVLNSSKPLILKSWGVLSHKAIDSRATPYVRQYDTLKGAETIGERSLCVRI